MKHSYALPVVPQHVRKLADPTNPNALRTIGYALFQHLPFDIPYDPNPRKPTDKSLKSSVASDIRNSATEARGKFHLLNGGIYILADSIDYNNNTGMLTFVIDTDKGQGLYNGGHTLKILDGEINAGFQQDANPLLQQYCNFDIQTNVAAADLASIAEGRNSSVALKEKTLLDYQEAFQWIKDALAAKPYADKIGYVESHDRPEDIERIVCRLTAVNPLLYDKDKHPIIAYSSKRRCMEQLEQDREKYKVLSPILPQILELYEYIISEAYDVYQTKYPNGKLLQMAGGVTKLERKQDEHPFTGAKVKYRIAEGWLIPLLAAFRVLIKVESGKASWQADPKVIYKRIGGDLIRILYETGGTLGSNPNAVGKYENVYRQLYSAVDSELKSVQLEELKAKAN
jgi:hypothetical protein